MGSKRRSHVWLWTVTLAAACAGDPVAPTLAACHSTVQALALSVGADTAIDPLPTGGCVLFPANASMTDSAEYLLVPQAATDVADRKSSFKLAGGVPVMAAPPIAAPSQMASPAQQFHDALRLMEQNRAWSSLAGPAAAARLAAPRVPRAPPVGDPRTFKVLSDLVTGNTVLVNATAVSVGQHVALYVDNTAPQPPNGLSTADYDNMRLDFDTLLYEADTAAFGRESDIDGNGLVIVLMTSQVNRLVTATQCMTSGYVGGFFLGADIDPLFAGQFNNGEIFYTMVADPNATLSCAHSLAQVQRVVPTTLIHEFQHMISYNQHVLLRGASRGEIQWLNEAMSHYAEELGGRAVLRGTLGVDTVRYCNFVRGDLANLALYWANPGAFALVDTSGVGGLAERGAEWLFVRYLVDQFAADTSVAAADALTQRIDQTNLTGAQNVATVTGQPFAKIIKQWALAAWVNDLPGFTASPTMKYKYWKFRTDYPVLSSKCTVSPNPPPFPASFPLAAVASAGPSIYVKGTIWAGSGAAYLRALQAPGAAGFPLLFSDSSGVQLSSVVAPRLNVIRIR